jgi:hypothetical protein
MPHFRRKKMPLSLSERRPLIREFSKRYRTAGRKQKFALLDEFLLSATRTNTKKTTYNRKYASWLLRNVGKLVAAIDEFGRPIRFVAQRVTRRRKRVHRYAAIISLLESVYRTSAYLSPTRLRAFLDDVLPGMRQRGEINCTDGQFALLSAISSAEIGRHLKPFRVKHQIKGRSHTKRGTLLKHQIPVRHHGDWPDLPGYFEVDLVGHDGGDANGQFCYTLTAYDVFTTSTYLTALPNKAQRWSQGAIKDVREGLPYPMKGLDSDCGGEFINHSLFNYCNRKPKIDFTRAREGRKNDNCYVEEKNNSVVRKHVGYDRHESQKSYVALSRMYKECLNPFLFHFQPSMKLIERVRIGGKTKKKYDRPRTPYMRVMNLPEVSKETKERLRLEHEKLSPVVLGRELIRYQERLMKLAVRRSTASERSYQQDSARVNNL